jgi:DNA-binding response OmpR family regulator
MRHDREVMSRDQILRDVWGYGHDPGTNTLDVYIGYLRRKLASAGIEGAIATIRSLGYRFDGGRR